MSKVTSKMTKKQAMVSDSQDDSSSSGEETIEVQVENAKSRKRAPSKGLTARGKAVQSKGVEARKEKGAASTRERELQRLAKKNDQLERLAKIDEQEKAEHERSQALARASQDKSKDKAAVASKTADGELNMRLARIEELMTARQAESADAKKKKAPAKKRAPKEAADTDSDDEPPRQKAVKRSAKTELKRRAGAEEEHLHGRSNLLNNKNKGRAVELEQQERMRQLAMNIMPGAYQ